jgi:hypothetical protein
VRGCKAVAVLACGCGSGFSSGGRAAGRGGSDFGLGGVGGSARTAGAGGGGAATSAGGAGAGAASSGFSSFFWVSCSLGGAVVCASGPDERSKAFDGAGAGFGCGAGCGLGSGFGSGFGLGGGSKTKVTGTLAGGVFPASLRQGWKSHRKTARCSAAAASTAKRRSPDATVGGVPYNSGIALSAIVDK